MLKEPELNIFTLQVEDIYEEIYKIALSTDDKKIELEAWKLLLDCKKNDKFNDYYNSLMDKMMNLLDKNCEEVCNAQLNKSK